MKNRAARAGDYIRYRDFMGKIQYGVIQRVGGTSSAYRDQAWIEWERGVPTWVSTWALTRIDPLTALAMQA